MKYRMHPVQEHNMQLLWLILHGDLYINMQLLLDALGSPGVSVTLHGNVTGSKACIGEQVMYIYGEAVFSYVEDFTLIYTGRYIAVMS